MKIPLEKQGLERSMLGGGAEVTGVRMSYKKCAKGCAKEIVKSGP